MKAEVLVDIHNVSFSYNSYNQVLKDVTFQIYKGDFVAIIGPNGGGKSTFLKLLLGLLPLQDGKITIEGKNPGEKPEIIGYVPQYIDSATTFPIRVEDFILTGLIGINKTIDEKKQLQETLSKLEIEDLRGKLVDRLSGGQRQKVYVARALISDPEILILDEPTANVDFAGQKFMYEFFNSLIPQKTIIIVSHQFQFVLCYATKIAFLDKTICFHEHVKCEKGDVMDQKFHCHLDMLEYLRGQQ
jgi:zinc transport system ATP-binding protein